MGGVGWGAVNTKAKDSKQQADAASIVHDLHYYTETQEGTIQSGV